MRKDEKQLVGEVVHVKVSGWKPVERPRNSWKKGTDKRPIPEGSPFKNYPWQ